MKPTASIQFKSPIIYSIVLSFILGVSSLYAQIIYTDIEPDYASANLNDSYNLDLNNDGTVDFTILNNYWEGYFEYFTELTSNPNGVNGAISLNPWNTHTQALNYGMEIFSNPHITYGNAQSYAPVSYIVSGYCHGGETGCDYDWGYTTDKYVGFRFLINGQTHYGWARLSVLYGIEWTLKDYAYQATPNTMILAGQMPTLGLGDFNASIVKIASSQGSITIFHLNEIVQYTLFTVTGQAVLKGTLSKDSNVINASMFSSGIYFMELTSLQTGQTIKKKFII